MKKSNQLISIMLVLGIFASNLQAVESKNGLTVQAGGSNINTDICEYKNYAHEKKNAEIITWRDESAITVLSGERIVFRKAFFSPSGTNGSFIEDGVWSPDGSYFAFRLLSSGGHMPYRIPVKIFKMHDASGKLIDAEEIVAKIPHISNISVGPYKEPYIHWLSDTKLQVSVASQDKQSDSGMYVIDLETLSAKKKDTGIIQENDTQTDLAVPRGTRLRGEILDALREPVKQAVNMDIVFVVEYIKAKRGWAWVHAFPQSKDGKSHFEDVFALLKKENGKWEVVEWPCAEEENPDCITHPAYFKNLKKRFPDIPDKILPND